MYIKDNLDQKKGDLILLHSKFISNRLLYRKQSVYLKSHPIMQSLNFSCPATLKKEAKILQCKYSNFEEISPMVQKVE